MPLKASLVITGDASSATSALSQVDAALDQNTAAAKRAAAANDDLGKRAERSARQAQAGYTNFGRQVQDIGVQLQGGANIGTIIAQQGGQVADAVAQMGGRFSGLASFLAGPWGAALIVGTGLLANLAEGLLATGSAADASGKKQLTLYDALQKAAFGSVEARKALADYRAEQERSAKTTDSMIKINLASAEARLKDALATRQQLAAELAKRVGTAKDVASLGEDPSGAEELAARTRKKIEDLYRGNGKDQEGIYNILADIRGLRIQDAVRDAAGAADPLKAINNRYDDMAEAAKRAARGNDALAASLKGTLTQIERQRAAALKNQRDSARSSSSSSGLFGREIDLGQAKSIAQGAGFHVNSDLRTIAEQRWLYDHKRTAANPVAFPNANAPHVRGDALDIAFGPGVSPESIRKAYAAEGVKLTKVLKESGHFHIEWSTSGADKVQREAEQLANWGDQVAARIAGIGDQFSDLPPAVARANAATRDLDKTIADLTQRHPPGFEKMIADATALKGVIADSLTKPFDDYLRQAQQGAVIDQLVLAGKRDQAAALQVALGFQRLMIPLTQEQLGAIQQTVIAERERGEMLQRQQEMIGNYLDATRSLKSEIEGILAGTGKLSNLPQIFKNLSSKVLGEKLFGSMFRDLDKWVQDSSGMKDATTSYVGSTKTTAGAALDLAAAFRTAGGQIRVAQSGGNVGQALADLTDPTKPPIAPEFGEIKVEATLPTKPGSLFDVSVDDYMRKLSQGLGNSIGNALNEALGTHFFDRFKPAIASVVGGYMTGGAPGGILGAVKAGVFEYGPDLWGKGINEKLLKGLDGAIKGAGTGSIVSGIGNAIGLKLNQTGSQIGGAIGSFIPIPGGEIIGSLAGGLLGNVFGKRPRGAASVTNSGLSGSTNDASLTQSILGQGSDLQGSIASIAERLGATIGSYDVGLGRYKDFYQVSSSANDPRLGNSYFSRDSRSALYDGTDAAKATAAALAEAIRDGAIQGVSAKVSKALTSNPDIDKALADALKVQDLETLLGGLSGTIEKAFTSFEAQAKERLRIATSYGFDVVKIEELNAKERLKLSQKLLDEQVGSLQRLIDDMTGGSLFEGSAVDKRTALLDQIAKAKADTAAGTEGAADKLANLLEQLNSVSKDVYGTTGGFAADRGAILDQARDAITQANQRIADAQAKSDPALVQTNAALDENNDQNARLISGIDRINEQLAGLSFAGSGSFGGLSNLARLASTADY